MAAGPMREEHGTWIRKEVDSILHVDRIKLSKLGLVQSGESLTEGAQAMGNGQGPIEQGIAPSAHSTQHTANCVAGSWMQDLQRSSARRLSP